MSVTPSAWLVRAATTAVLLVALSGAPTAAALMPPAHGEARPNDPVYEVPPPPGWLAQRDDQLASTSAPAVAPSADPLPTCRYRDEITRFSNVSQWRTTLLDTILKVRRSYVPPGLVPVSRADIKGTGLVRDEVIPDLRQMAAAARAAGKPIAVRSAYRSYQTQVATFQAWVDQSGYQQALLYAARPGHSEHQLGTTIDLRSARSAQAPWDYRDWAETGPGRWMKANAWKYGFLMSYPDGKRRQTCYGYEPWHYRYVGRELAADIHESGQTVRRYLWEHFESVP